MKNNRKNLARLPHSPYSAKALQSLVALLVLFLMMGCNTQKASTSTDQKPAAQRERGGPPSIDEIFAMDANNDGKLAKSEIEGPLLRDFSTIDTNEDGFITRSELENAPKPQRRQGPPKNN